ncbi:MAG TPA: hypothetical protein VFN67_06650 [Polyangiales bacterium]|nr:hypothetical protein [Polyangiales bacterium]
MMTRNSVLVCVALTLGCGSQAGTPSGSSATKPEQPATATAGASGGAAAPSGGVQNTGSAGKAPAAHGGAGAPATTQPAAAGNTASPAAGSGADGADAGADTPAEPGSTSTFPSVTDFTGNGPYASVTVTSTGPNNNYTVYHPKDLAPNGAKNPIVGWMSGGGTDPSLYPLLPLLATHGFVVVASNTIPGIGDEANLGKEIIAGIDWAIAENARDGSVFYQKLDTTELASAGYSMGSLATFQIAGDKRLTTTVHISGGNMAPDPIHNLHAPAAFLCGIPGDDTCDILSTTCDIAAANCDKDFAAATAPVFYGNFSNGHLGILTPPFQEQIQTEVVAWLRWQLMGDAAIKARFVGEQCGVCTDDRWKVQQKNLN